MKIKIIKKDRVIDKEIVVLTAIAGIALGNLLYNISTKDNGYVNINGEYFGLYNLRDKMNADYVETKFGIDKDNL